jgi:hypothetical protein
MTKSQEDIPLIINARWVKRFVTVAVMFVWLVSGFFSVINYLVRTISTSDDLKEFIHHVFTIFYVGAEFNFPSWFSSLSLMSSTIVIALIAYVLYRQHKPYVLHWVGLSGLFILFGLDEFLTIRETVGTLLGTFFRLTDIFYFSWPVLGLLGVTVISIVYWRFVAELPPRTRQLFILSVIVIVSGAMGVEIVRHYYKLIYGQANWGYEFIEYVEKALELSGMGLFFYTFVLQLETILVNNRVTIFIKRRNDS